MYLIEKKVFIFLFYRAEFFCMINKKIKDNRITWYELWVNNWKNLMDTLILDNLINISRFCGK